MNLPILGFPHAYFDDQTMRGFLAHYYPYDAVRAGTLAPDRWRNESYSGEILDFKEGRDQHISVFTEPFDMMIGLVLDHLRMSSATLVPLPSSRAKSDAAYSRIPRDKTRPGSPNRDDRVEVFCQKLATRRSGLSWRELIVRVQSKPEKADWATAQMLQTLDLGSAVQRLNFNTELFLLVDDVATTYTTANAAIERLRSVFPHSLMAVLTIGRSASPTDFQSIYE